MTSLHLVLALILVYLRCLAGAPIYNQELNYMQIQDEVEKNKNAECDAKLYSPFDIECIEENLRCTRQELDTVIGECFPDKILHKDNIQHLRRLGAFIDLQLNHSSKTASKTCVCESQSTPKKTYKDFLKNILRLVEALNSSTS